MVILRKISNSIDIANNFIGRIFLWAIVPMTILPVIEIIMRRFLGSPTIWSFEVITQIYGAYFMMVAAYGLLFKSHVSIDIFTSKISKKKQRFLEIVGYAVFFFPFVIICLWKSFLYALESWQMMETSWSAFAPPLYPIKTVMFVAFLLLLMQGISEIIKKYTS